MKVIKSLNIWAALLIAAAGSVGLAQELLTNGDFERDINVGWFIDSLEGMTPYYDTIDRDTSFHSNSGYEARVKKYDSAFAKLFQTIDVTTTNLRFGVNAKLYAVELNQATAWAAAAIVLSYLNRSGAVLGETRICYPTPHCPWTNSSTLHLIVAPDSTWRTYSFKVSDELANLPGVPPAEIAKVRVALFDTTDGCWGSHCLARVLADNASVFDVTGINEGNAGVRTDARSIIQGSTVITRAMPLVITLNDPGASGTLRIYNVRGQLVSDLGAQTGNATVAWSPVDGSGSRVPSGTYFVRYESTGTSASHKFVVAE